MPNESINPINPSESSSSDTCSMRRDKRRIWRRRQNKTNLKSHSASGLDVINPSDTYASSSDDTSVNYLSYEPPYSNYHVADELTDIYFEIELSSKTTLKSIDENENCQIKHNFHATSDLVNANTTELKLRASNFDMDPKSGKTENLKYPHRPLPNIPEDEIPQMKDPIETRPTPLPTSVVPSKDHEETLITPDSAAQNNVETNEDMDVYTFDDYSPLASFTTTEDNSILQKQAVNKGTEYAYSDPLIIANDMAAQYLYNNATASSAPGELYNNSMVSSVTQDLYNNATVSSVPQDLYNNATISSAPADLYNNATVSSVPQDLYNNTTVSSAPGNSYNNATISLDPEDVYA